MAVSAAKKRSFSKRVIDLREERELTQAELARKVDVTQTCVWNWESANTYPRPMAMKRLAQALGTTPAHLNGEEADSSFGVDGENANRPLAEIIMEARERVAAAAGLAVSKVRVVLDCGD